MRKVAYVLAVSAFAFAAPASASVVLSDNFDSEAGAPTTLNYTGFANFNVTGQVDLVGTGNPYGTTGTGSYVDLDGTSGPGRITTKDFYSFNAGDVITLSMRVSANQRDGNSDDFFAGFSFLSDVDVQQYTLGGAWADSLGDEGAVSDINTEISLIGPGGSYDLYTISFVAGNAGSLQAYAGTTSGDNIGPLLDDFSLDISAGSAPVPEPATLALMLGGLGLAARRRKAATR